MVPLSVQVTPEDGRPGWTSAGISGLDADFFRLPTPQPHPLRVIVNGRRL